MELALTIIVAIVDLALVMWNVSLVKTILRNREARLLRKLRKYRSTKLGRLYRKAVGETGKKVAFVPNYVEADMMA